MKAEEFYKTLTKNQKKYLSRFECGWCDMNMGRSSCGVVFESCPDEKRINKAKKCLEGYKPRKGQTDGKV